MARIINLKALSGPAGGPAKASIIDMGSNSLKLVNYTVDSHNSFKPYHQESVRTKLAEGLVDGVLSEGHMLHTMETLKFFKNVIDFENIKYVIAFATSSVRDASNRNEFLERIRAETGFDFQVLSEREEALYSYAGALSSLCLPSTVFFDLGGGSLEIVAAENFEIRYVASLPLGALRLTQTFSTDLGYTSAGISDMRAHILERLPSKESLGLSAPDKAILVGVGGTLRAVAKYYQYKMDHPLKKLHNYSVPLHAMEAMLQDFMLQTPDELSTIESMSPGRTSMVQAGTMVISELVKSLGFDSLVVSAQALREGVLALSLQFPDDFVAHKIDMEHVHDITHLSCQPDTASKYVDDLVCMLFSMSLITDRERIILTEAILQIDMLSSFRDVDNVLYTVLDEDSMLSHREQLLVALSLIYSKKKRKAEVLITRFHGILQQSDKKIIRRVASVVALCEIFHKTGTPVRPRAESQSALVLEISSHKDRLPEMLIRQACARVENALGITIRTGQRE